jgi:phosphoribosylformylglycinamidine synthase PurS subunit
MKVKIHITLKKGVLDPQGTAIASALKTLGFDCIENVRQGKLIEIEVGQKEPDEAKKKAKEMCEKLLANTVIEDYQIEVLENQ